MTCREKLAKEHPELVSDIYLAGCYMCPHDYDYLDKPGYCRGSNVTLCASCWNREIPEEKPKEPNPYDEATNKKKRKEEREVLDYIYFDVVAGCWKSNDTSKMTIYTFIDAVVEQCKRNKQTLMCEYDGYRFVVDEHLNAEDRADITAKYANYKNKESLRLIRQKDDIKEKTEELAKSYFNFYTALIHSGFTNEQAFMLLREFIRS